MEPHLEDPVHTESFTEASKMCTLEAMDTPLLTIAEAAAETGRSASTIRRIIRTITDASKHPDRNGIEPLEPAVEALKKKGENFTWKIRKDVLLKHCPPAQKEDKNTEHSASSPHGDILQILERELAIKNQQIEKQWEVIHSLNDRLREGNILMGSLQKRLSLPAADAGSDSPVEVSAVTPSHGAPQKASTEASKKAKKKPAKKGFLQWLRM
jgi:hypothetical protein